MRLMCKPNTTHNSTKLNVRFRWFMRTVQWTRYGAAFSVCEGMGSNLHSIAEPSAPRRANSAEIMAPVRQAPWSPAGQVLSAPPTASTVTAPIAAAIATTVTTPAAGTMTTAVFRPFS